MKSRMAGVIWFFILTGVWLVTIVTVQLLQAAHYG